MSISQYWNVGIFAYCRTKNPTCTGKAFVTVFLFISISNASSTTTSSCRTRLLLTTMSVHVGDGLPQQIHGVRDDGLVWVVVSLAPGRGHCIAEPPEARELIVLDDLLDKRHLESVVQVPLQEGRGEQDLIASITAHEHAPRSRHDAVFFGVSDRDRRASDGCS